MSQNLNGWTVLTMLKWATGFFEKKNVPQPRLSIEWLLAHVLQTKRLDLYLKYDRPLSKKELDQLRPLVKKRAKHEPLQYITGSTDFFNLEIKVTPDVLIPRPETEQLVEMVLNEFPDKASFKNCLDLGTGSGCIPIAIKKNRPAWNITGIDISEAALNIAKENALKHDLEIHFEKGDFLSEKFTPKTALFDIIISNPPYILPRERNTLENEVKNHEPAIALFCENLESVYNGILRTSEQYLNKHGTTFVELNASKAKEVSNLFEDHGWNVQVIEDYDHKPRFLKAQRDVYKI